jgi:putative hydrolase of the HAD superfamily
VSVVPAAQLDAVTVDAYGTLVVLEDPTDRLLAALRARGVDRPRADVSAAFRAEADFYRPRSLLGRDPESLTVLRRDCVQVFLGTLAVELDPAEFVPDFMAAVVFRLAEGAVSALEALRSAGLALACVANWDTSLGEQLERVGVGRLFEVVVSSAAAGAEKPDPGIFERALGELGVAATRALHIGDEEVDRIGAAAAGLAFAPPPLATLPERLGL